jgi:hypothetical protein
MASEVGRKVIALGYMAGIAISFVGLIASALYLWYFMALTPDPVSIDSSAKLLGISAERRMLLLSTAIFVAMSFGFLGFSLFLIQAEGEVDGSIEAGDYKFKFVRLSPGLFVILCATVIIIVASTFRIQYNLNESGGSEAALEDGAALDPLAPKCVALGTCPETGPDQ